MMTNRQLAIAIVIPILGNGLMFLLLWRFLDEHFKALDQRFEHLLERMDNLLDRH